MTANEKSKAKKLILVVEDNLAESSALARVLRHAGYHSFECRTLLQARIALRTKPDVIVVGMHLPDGSGVDFCRELYTGGDTVGTPVILVSAKGDLAFDPTQFIASGAHSFFSKPLVKPELIETLKSIFEK